MRNSGFLNYVYLVPSQISCNEIFLKSGLFSLNVHMVIFTLFRYTVHWISTNSESCHRPHHPNSVLVHPSRIHFPQPPLLRLRALISILRACAFPHKCYLNRITKSIDFSESFFSLYVIPLRFVHIAIVFNRLFSSLKAVQ